MQPKIFKNLPEALKKQQFVDAYSSAVKELFFLDHPGLKKDSPNAENLLNDFLKNSHISDCWIYFPEKKILVRTVGEPDYFKLRTARNKNVITQQEQTKFRNLTVGIAGLSVGSCVLQALVISGGPKRIKIADYDNLEISNLNRIRGRITEVGQNKTLIAAQEIWAIDPFAKLELYARGLTENNLKKFLLATPRLSAFIDEMDSLDLKIHSRILCRKHKIPVLMATDNGDSVILDVERFDLEPKRKLFHGLIDERQVHNLKQIDYKTWLRLATKIVGPEYLTERMQNSLLEIGKSIAGVPQLGTTAAMAGAAISFSLRRIANKQPLPSGRYLLGLEEKLVPRYHSKKSAKDRLEQAKKFKQMFASKN